MFFLPKQSFLYTATLAIVTLLLLAPPIFADSYTATVIAYTQDENFFGIDSHGDFTINVSNNAEDFSACGGMQFSPCYQTFYRNHPQPVISTTLPPLAWDNGSPCNPIVSPGMDPLNAVCNNGHEIFGGFYFPTVPDPNLPNDGEIRGVWTGPNVIADFLGPQSLDGGFINSRGDAVFIDGLHDTLVFARDQTTSAVPEPASLILVGIGCISSLIAGRRKLR